MRLFIGIPAHDGRIDVRTMACVQALTDLVRSAWGADAVTHFFLIGNSDVCSARDEITYQFLRTGADVLFQADTDVVFPPGKVGRLLGIGVDSDNVQGPLRPLCGLTYPLKQIDAHNLKVSGGDLATSVRFAFKPTSSTPTADADGFVEVDGFGAGCMVSTRAVFERMIDRSREIGLTLYQSGAAEGTAGQRWGFFQRMLDRCKGEPATYYGDDHAFCARWRACGEACYVLANAELGHVGAWEFRGNLATVLDARRAGMSRSVLLDVDEGTIESNGVILGLDPTKCDGVYPRTRNGQCQGCGTTTFPHPLREPTPALST